jgi:hypothetical protein
MKQSPQQTETHIVNVAVMHPSECVGVGTQNPATC